MIRRAAVVGCCAAFLGAGIAVAASLPGIPKAFHPYKSWHKVNAKPIRPTPTTAHPGTKNVYASKKKVAGRYPVGTLIVKEGFTTVGGKRFVSLIATMRKQRGLDPAHGNWKFIEWTRSSPNARFNEIARDATCWGCHAQAKRTDWVYTTR
jgi:hypothetical protein